MTVISSLVFLVSDISAVADIFIILRFVFNKTPVRKVWAYILFAALFAVNAFAIAPALSRYLYDYDGFADMISAALLIAASYALFDDRRQTRTFFTVIICDCTVEMFYSLFAQYTGDNLILEKLIITVFHLVLAAGIALASRRSDINVLPEVFSGVPKWIWAALLLFELTCYYKEFGDAASWYRVLYTISSAAVIMLALYLIFKIFWLVRKQNGILEQLETNRSYGERLITDDAQLRAFRHDYKNHVIVINSLLSAGRTDEAREYLSSLSDSMDGIVNRISSGNFVADALLNNKAIAALAGGGELRFEGRIPESVIPNADLCVILANLLDNAIEAIRKNPADKRTVTVTAGINKNDFFLKIENPAPFAVDTKTTKTDKRNHGFGIKNARRAAERNDGALVTTVADGVFRASVTCAI